MMYIDGEMEEDIIEEYWDVLKDINIEEEKKKEEARKKARKNNPRRNNLLEICRAQDSKPRGHI